MLLRRCGGPCPAAEISELKVLKSMIKIAQDTPLGFPAHTLPFRHKKIYA